MRNKYFEEAYKEVLEGKEYNGPNKSKYELSFRSDSIAIDTVTSPIDPKTNERVRGTGVIKAALTHALELAYKKDKPYIFIDLISNKSLKGFQKYLKSGITLKPNENKIPIDAFTIEGPKMVKEGKAQAAQILNGNKQLVNLLAEIDPTSTNKYVEVFARILKNSEDQKDAFAELKLLSDQIEEVERKKKTFDVSKIKTVDELKAKLKEGSQRLTKSTKDFRGLKEGTDYLKLGDLGGGWIGYIPLHSAASNIMAGDTLGDCDGNWCIRYPRSWKKYTQKDQLGFIFIIKNGKKYAITISSNRDIPIPAIWNINNNVVPKREYANHGLQFNYSEQQLFDLFWKHAKNKIIVESAQKTNTKIYRYWKNCKDFEDGNEVQQIVDQDDLSYGDETYYHNPEYQISSQKFKMLTGNKVNIDEYVFFGYNPGEDIVFAYNFDDDRHDFFT